MKKLFFAFLWTSLFLFVAGAVSGWLVYVAFTHLPPEQGDPVTGLILLFSLTFPLAMGALGCYLAITERLPGTRPKE